ncbi:MAG: hypothetical protein R8M38_03120 [Mariprofundaceae bacterium]
MILNHLSDIIGIIGVLLVLWAYYRLQSGRLAAASIEFSAYNAVGSGMILFSLCFDFNLASFFIESAWTTISLIGVYVAMKKEV